MNFSVGIWAHMQVPLGVVYRWEADGGASGTGFVLLETGHAAVRPSDAHGHPSGSLLFDAASGGLTGQADGVDRMKFVRIAAAIVKRYLAAGEAPENAHTYFG